MPSFNETFGLVYIEAMSQGLPVIYSKGQGIDGYFNEGKVGFSVNPGNISDIATRIENILENYDEMNKNAITAVKEFKWSKIADKYIDIYNS
jgi:L-malate glycosyltransferase